MTAHAQKLVDSLRRLTSLPRVSAPDAVLLDLFVFHRDQAAFTALRSCKYRPEVLPIAARLDDVTRRQFRESFRTIANGAAIKDARIQTLGEELMTAVCSDTLQETKYRGDSHAAWCLALHAHHALAPSEQLVPDAELHEHLVVRLPARK